MLGIEGSGGTYVIFEAIAMIPASYHVHLPTIVTQRFPERSTETEIRKSNGESTGKDRNVPGMSTGLETFHDGSTKRHDS